MQARLLNGRLFVFAFLKRKDIFVSIQASVTSMRKKFVSCSKGIRLQRRFGFS
jgi:hypothetical protein